MEPALQTIKSRKCELKEEIKFIKVDGGASVNKLLVQFQSDILEIPVIKPLLAETTSLGAARLAGLAVGFYSLDDFKDEDFERYEPKLDSKEVEEKYNKWLKAVHATIEF